MDASALVPILVAALLGGGGAGFIIALLKIRPEAGQIVVNAAEGAVLVQTGVIKSLNEELRRNREEVHRYREENGRLRDRVTALETELASLKKEVHDQGEALNG